MSHNTNRLAELEAIPAKPRSRQEAQPKNAVKRRALLAVLIAAFEPRRDLVQAELEMKR